jgi:putative solute:sodium symporter small subunit
MVLIMLVIWVLGVFGFQALLLLLEKPTAEPTLTQYEGVEEAIMSGKASTDEKQVFARSLLMVLGKNIVLKDAHRQVLKNALSATVMSLDATAAGNADTASKAIGLGTADYDPLLSKILASSLVASPAATMAAEDKEALPGIMKLYLIHNRSVLTDTRFIGFPFHYWYTAQFLLILFVGLCLVFCKLTDKHNHTFNLETD